MIKKYIQLLAIKPYSEKFMEKVLLIYGLLISICGCSDGIKCETTVPLDVWSKMTKEEKNKYWVCKDENGNILSNY